MITQQYLLDTFCYDSNTGTFTYKVKRGTSIKPGDVAGYQHHSGYRCICIGNKSYSAHRLAWLYMTGKWPTKQIDHINGIKNDNRFSNLREATRSENCQNKIKQSNNTSGYTGVSWHKATQKWSANIKLNGKQTYLGVYDTPEEAHQVYLKTRQQLHTFQPIPRT